MPPSYLQTCILAALKQAKGNETKARQIIALQAMEDEKLLQALAKPHLSGIVAHAVGRIAIQQRNKKSDDFDDLPLTPKTVKGSKNEFGLDLLKALGGQNVPKFGIEDAAPHIGKKQASQQHVNALKLMAAKSKTTKKR